ncbi:MAG: hypothetical protein R2780_11240 [Crocinitomicaceae bacterium]
MNIMNLNLLNTAFMLLWVVVGHSQNNNNSSIKQESITEVFEKEDTKEEIDRLKFKKDRLEYRLAEVKKSPVGREYEISQIEGTINYIDHKIKEKENILKSEIYAQEFNIPEKGSLSDEEYRKKKMENLPDNKSGNMTIKTTLTQEEFDRLPKDRQEKILSMPVRYTISK